MALISLYFLNIFYNIIVLFYDYKNINVADDMVNYYDKTFIIWNVPQFLVGIHKGGRVNCRFNLQPASSFTLIITDTLDVRPRSSMPVNMSLSSIFNHTFHAKHSTYNVNIWTSANYCKHNIYSSSDSTVFFNFAWRTCVVLAIWLVILLFNFQQVVL